MASSESQGSRYLDSRTLDRIKRLDVRARLVVEGFITGGHRSPYHGFAVEFATHREYAPGDDLRHIDWKVWSKTDRLFIKEFEEETNLKCHLILDRSKSMDYTGADGVNKYNYAATATASLAYLMQQQQDAVGLVLFSNQVDLNLRPSTHPSHLKLLFHELEQRGCDQETEISSSLLQVAAQVRQRSMVIVVSDLLLPVPALQGVLRQFRLRRHEVVVLQVLHSDELTFPFDDNTLFKGLEQDVQLLAEPRALRRSYLEALERHQGEVKKVCAAHGVDHVVLDTSKPLDGALASYLSFRAKSRRRLTGRI
ncbi:MAG TPA: DUF58 domain-containing protein [Pirellulaceae bacterium]|nr:DUF58 domain-containing protein [Pirellulaceae bacterium]